MNTDSASFPISLAAASSPCPGERTSPCHTSSSQEAKQSPCRDIQKTTTFQLLLLARILAAQILFLQGGGCILSS